MAQNHLDAAMAGAALPTVQYRTIAFGDFQEIWELGIFSTLIYSC